MGNVTMYGHLQVVRSIQWAWCHAARHHITVGNWHRKDSWLGECICIRSAFVMLRRVMRVERNSLQYRPWLCQYIQVFQDSAGTATSGPCRQVVAVGGQSAPRVQRCAAKPC